MSTSTPTSSGPRTLLKLPATFLVHAHSLLAVLAFGGALVLALGYHYKSVCKNEVAGWPEEWWPSVSASIGDHIPERPFFQILIALNSGPRMLLILLQWLITRREWSEPRPDTSESKERGMEDSSGVSSSDVVAGRAGARESNKEEQRTRVDGGRGWGLADWVAIIGLARTFTCGGWVYVTSSDQHDYHDISMIAYMILTIPWMFGTISMTMVEDQRVLRWRRITSSLFFATIIPLIYHFIQHKTYRVPGAYTKYAFFEWGLIIFDVAFDSLGVGLLQSLSLQVVYLDVDKASADSPGSSVSSNTFALAKPIMAASTATSDTRMEYTDFEGGWAPATETHDLSHGYFALGAGRKWLSFLSDAYLAYCFWTIFTALGLQLFYFSVWKLALSGSELALLALLSPFLLQIPTISRYATSRRGQSTLSAASLGLGLLAYKGKTPAIRLLMIMGANVAGLPQLTGRFVRLHGSADAQSEGAVLLLGLLLSLPVKFANNSVNPLWCIVDAASGGWNKTGILVAAIASIEKWYRPLVDESYPTAVVKENFKLASQKSSAWERIALALGLGALLSLTQTLLMDAGTVISWTWTGYPISGPLLLRDAAVVVAAASSGLATSIALDWANMPLILRRPNSFAWSALGCASCHIFTYYEDWPGFAGGCGLVFYLARIFPSYMQAASRSQIASTFGWAMLLVIGLDVLSVLTVAYAFVPGGQYLRKRTDVVMGFSMLCLLAGNWSIARQQAVLPGYEVISLRRQYRDWQTKFVLLGIVVATLSASSYVLETKDIVPYHSANGVWTGGIWTVHFGVDLDGRDSQARMLDLIRDMEVDVIGLLETDLHRFVYGNRDLTRKISEELGYYVDIGPGPNKHTWGAALLSKFPILESRHLLLPSPNGELAPAIHAKLLIHEQIINVIVSHNGQEEDALDRELQSQALAKIMSDSYPEPFVFLGYLVTKTGAPRPAPYEIIMLDGRMWDVEWEDRGRWCQYIALRNLWRVAYAKVSESDITDTELQVAKFVIPTNGTSVFYTTNEALYFHTYEEKVPEEWRMPSMFRGNGTRGHKYLAFDGPIYYHPPDSFWDSEMSARFPGYGALGISGGA